MRLTDREGDTLPALLRATLKLFSVAWCQEGTPGTEGGTILPSQWPEKGVFRPCRTLPPSQQRASLPEEGRKRQLCLTLSSLGATYCENCSHERRKKVKLESYHLQHFILHSCGAIYALPSPFLLIFSFSLKHPRRYEG